MLILVVKIYLQPVIARRTMCYSDSLLNHMTKITFACKDVTFQGLKPDAAEQASFITNHVTEPLIL